MKSVERNSASLIFMLYALAALLMAIFALLWSNKGASGFWDKSLIDWLTISWLMCVSAISVLASMHCYTKRKLNYFILFALLAALSANMLYVSTWGQNDASISYVIIHGVVIFACGLWWHSSYEMP